MAVCLVNRLGVRLARHLPVLQRGVLDEVIRGVDLAHAFGSPDLLGRSLRPFVGMVNLGQLAIAVSDGERGCAEFEAERSDMPR